MVLMEQDLRNEIEEGELSAGRCQTIPGKLQGPRLLTSFPGGNVGREVRRVQWVSLRVTATLGGIY